MTLRELSKKLSISLPIVSSALFSLNVMAKDYGTFGDLYEITEVDARQLYMISAAKVDWEKARSEIDKSIENISEQHQFSMATPNVDKIYYIDPSKETTQKIEAPTLVNGQLEWVTVVEKGERINPLDYFKPIHRRIFINGNDIDQVKFLKQLVDRYAYPLQIILTEGDQALISEEISQHVYLANEHQLERDQIKFTPSLFSIGRGENSRKLQVTALTRPFSVSRLMEIAP